MIESKYDKVYSQRTEQAEIYQFVESKSGLIQKWSVSLTILNIFVQIGSIKDVIRGFNSTIFAYG